MFEIKGKYTTALVSIDEVEPECVAQITNFVNHPAFTNPIAIMPDTHAGKGSVIGFTMPLGEKVVIYCIGVDISCGMLSAEVSGKNFSRYSKVEFKAIDKIIRNQIPTGMNIHDRAVVRLDEFPYAEVEKTAVLFAQKYEKTFNKRLNVPKYDEIWFQNKCKQIGADLGKVMKSIGTLGGGNHALEIGVSDAGKYYITIHSGSRNFGLRICEYHQKKAVGILSRKHKINYAEEIKRLKNETSGKDLHESIKNLRTQCDVGLGIKMTGLEYLEGDDAAEYLFDMIFAQTYASLNRKTMMDIFVKTCYLDKGEIIESVHNYIDFEDMIIRKGAIRASKGMKVIIPLNMEDGIIFGVGKGNAQMNYSAPHGAGRLMSRTKAKEVIDLKAAEKRMDEKGIFSTCIPADESRDAYKKSEFIEEHIEPMVEVLFKAKPVYNIKAA